MDDDGQATPPPDLGPVLTVAAGDRHTCAVTAASGSVRCWGLIVYGFRRDTIDVLGPVASLALGAYHSCALTTAGAVLCWGEGDVPNVPSDLGPVSALASGGSHACAVTASKALRCWGDNWYGQSSPPPLENVTAVVAGMRHTCALLESGAVTCWGTNGDLDEVTAPADLGKVLASGALAAGADYTCVTTASGRVRCWGDTKPGPPPFDLGTPAALAAGHYHVCALIPTAQPSQQGCAASALLTSTEFKGGDLPAPNGQLMDSADGCCRNCSARTGCGHFTYITPSKRCWLKSSSGLLLRVYLAGAVSGSMAGAPVVPSACVDGVWQHACVCTCARVISLLLDRWPHTRSACCENCFGCCDAGWEVT